MFDLLLNHGSLGIFAAFLIWLYTNMQKRMDELVDRFQVQLGEIRKDQKKDIDMLRDRYDDVISKYDTDRARVRSQIKDRIEKIAMRLQSMDKRFTNMTIRQETCLDDVDGIKRQMVVMVEDVKAINNLLTSMEQEQRVRNLVQMAHGESTIPPKK
jgi:hypothetical protein